MPTSTAVTDTATLSGTNAVHGHGDRHLQRLHRLGCATLAPGGGGTAETITTPGTLPASAPVTLSSAGTYYWGVTYSGDTNNQTSSSTCGTAGEVETVTGVTTAQPTSVSTSLSGGAQSGTSISVPTSTAVTDTATLSGTNASTATGTVTYNVYTDSAAPRWPPVAAAPPRPSRRPGRCPLRHRSP